MEGQSLDDKQTSLTSLSIDSRRDRILGGTKRQTGKHHSGQENRWRALLKCAASILNILLLRRSTNARQVFVQHTEAQALPFEPKTRLRQIRQPAPQKLIHIEKHSHVGIRHGRLTLQRARPELSAIQLPTPDSCANAPVGAIAPGNDSPYNSR